MTIILTLIYLANKILFLFDDTTKPMGATTDWDDMNTHTSMSGTCIENSSTATNYGWGFAMKYILE